MGIRVLAVAEVVNILDLGGSLVGDVPDSNGADLIDSIVGVAVRILVFEVSPVNSEGEHSLRGGVACEEVKAVAPETPICISILTVKITKPVRGVELGVVIDAGSVEARLAV